MDMKQTKSGGFKAIRSNADQTDIAGNSLAELAAISAARGGRTTRRRKKMSISAWAALLGCGALAAGVICLGVIYFELGLAGGLPQGAATAPGQPQTTVIANTSQTANQSAGTIVGKNVAFSNGNSAPTGVAIDQTPDRGNGRNAATPADLDWHNGPLPGQLFLHDGNGDSATSWNSGHRRTPAVRLPVPTISQENLQQAWADQICMADSGREILQKAFHESSPVRQYLLFQGMLQRAISAGNCVQAIVVNRDILQRFRRTPLQADMVLVRALAKTTRASGQCRSLAAFALRVAGETRAARHRVDSLRCDQIALHAASLTGSQRLRKQAEQALRADSQGAERQRTAPVKIYIAPLR